MRHVAAIDTDFVILVAAAAAVTVAAIVVVIQVFGFVSERFSVQADRCRPGEYARTWWWRWWCCLGGCFGGDGVAVERRRQLRIHLQLRLHGEAKICSPPACAIRRGSTCVRHVRAFHRARFAAGVSALAVNDGRLPRIGLWCSRRRVGQVIPRKGEPTEEGVGGRVWEGVWLIGHPCHPVLAVTVGGGRVVAHVVVVAEVLTQGIAVSHQRQAAKQPQVLIRDEVIKGVEAATGAVHVWRQVVVSAVLTVLIVAGKRLEVARHALKEEKKKEV